jgi:hypothetical protein
MKLVRFMASPYGRALRVLLGLGLIVWGVRLSGIVGWIVAAVGFVPILAGAGDMCIFAPLFGYPMSGKQIRELSESH